jgi:(S)-2-hydroxyglutarate dehydrogenase
MTERAKSSGAPVRNCDLAVVGGGILGLATAVELQRRRTGARIVILERDGDVGAGQTTHNSGVIHSGIYYEPGSLKARLCVEGARSMYDFCAAHAIDANRCGKVIVATDERELPRLDELERRGRANGVELRRIDPTELQAIEPHVRGIAALHSPGTGIVDFSAVARALRDEFVTAGGSVEANAGVVGIERPSESASAPGADGGGGSRAGDSGRSGSVRAGVRLRHSRGELHADFAVFCAGAMADRLAVMDGADPDPRIVPFRGTYLRLRREDLVRGLVYPVPDPRLPFLGVHLTRHPRGGVLVGPTALLAPRGRSLAWPGTWRLMARFWRSGAEELGHALSRRRFVAAAQRFVPELTTADVEPGWAGYRAQALGRDGRLVDDFVFSATPTTLHVRNAPSPAATASLAIARHIADRVG